MEFIESSMCARSAHPCRAKHGYFCGEVFVRLYQYICLSVCLDVHDLQVTPKELQLGNFVSMLTSTFI